MRRFNKSKIRQQTDNTNNNNNYNNILPGQTEFLFYLKIEVKLLINNDKIKKKQKN